MLSDLAGLVLNAGEVQFVVIGGVAVAAYRHIRATQDLDIITLGTDCRSSLCA